MQRLHWLVLVAALGWAPFSGRTSFARTPLDTLSEAVAGIDSVERLKRAYDEMKAEPRVQELLRNPDHALVIRQRIQTGFLETTKFQHYYKGLEVVGSMTFHHRGLGHSRVRNLLSRFDLDIRPTVSPKEAVGIAQSITGGLKLAQAPELKILPNSPGQDAQGARLVYWIGFKPGAGSYGHEVIVDAHSGELIANLSDEIRIAPIQVYETNSKQVSIDPNSRKDLASISPQIPQLCEILNKNGLPVAVTPQNCDLAVDAGQLKPNADDSSKNALANAQAVLNYYSQVQGRDSYDGKGAPIISVVHVGTKYANASWVEDEDIMTYGDGDGKQRGDYTRALDIAAHEMTHGVVEKTANLLHMREAGSLNEAYADFFSKMVANDGDWAIGRKVFLKPHAQGFRNLADPGQIDLTYRDDNGDPQTIPYPSTMSEELKTIMPCDDVRNDSCFVHANSTIPSHAAYFVTQAIGKDKAEKLYYVVLTHYLNSYADFSISRDSTLAACQDLGYDTDTCAAVKKAFKKVEL